MNGVRSSSRIAMFVYNNCTTDARVLKEAASLAGLGLDVKVIAVLDRTTMPEESREGFEITRIERNPVHYRLLRKQRQVLRGLETGHGRWRRYLRRRLLRALAPRWRRQRRRLWRTRIRARRLLAPRWRRQRRRLWRTRIRARRLLAPRWREVRRPRRRVKLRARGASAVSRRRDGLATSGPTSLKRTPSVVPRSRALAEPPRPPRATPSPPTVEEPHDIAVEAPIGSASPAATTASRAASSVPGPPAAARRTRLWHVLMRLHKPLMFIDYYVRAYRLLSGERLDVVHAHDLNTLPVAAAVARAHRARLVYDSHELYTEISTLSERERKIWSLIERLLIGRADHVVTVCDSIAQELVDRYAVAPPLVLLNCPVRPTRASINREGNRLRDKTGLQDNPEPIILYQGGFAPNRGLPTLVEAAQAFDRGILVLMGWGRLAEDLARLIDQLQLQDRVVITDPVPQEELLSYTTGADVGVIPYKAVGLNNYYSTPNKLFEYMAAGVPIVSSRFPELVRFVEGLDIGRTFDPEDGQELASAVNFVLADPNRHQGMRDRARIGAERFSWESQAEQLGRLYDMHPVPSGTG